MIRLIITTMMLVLTGSQLVSAAELEEVLSEIANKQVRLSAFTEIRTAYFLERPVISKGTLEFKLPGTMIKRITEPESIEQHIEGDVLTIRQDGEIRHEISLSQNLEISAGINAIRWILSGNISALNQNFAIKFDSDNGDWRIKLLPKDTRVSIEIESLLILGNNARISLINIEQTNGDSIKTILYEQR
ncbi:MAG: LolA-related protein [Gammaproteobacteria bacterium]|nr:LolA-related protein [Gammaproteobacteria bacterium]